MAAEAVVFDIGNVLIEWRPERWYDARIGRARREALFAAVDLHAMNDRVDRGEPFRAVVWETAARHPQHADEIRMWHDHWLELASPAIPGSLQLLDALKARGVPVFALSNIGLDTFRLALPRYPFLASFDRAFLSGEIGTTKPDPEIYRLVEAECGHAPEALLFADDRAENIDAAAACGWGTHLFDGPEGLARRLVAEGLLSESEAA